MPDVLRVVHYLNAFFGGLGGEEEAHTPVSVQPGALGPGRLLEQAFAQQGQIVATIMCGDGYFADHEEAVVEQVRAQWQTLKPDGQSRVRATKFTPFKAWPPASNRFLAARQTASSNDEITR